MQSESDYVNAVSLRLDKCERRLETLEQRRGTTRIYLSPLEPVNEHGLLPGGTICKHGCFTDKCLACAQAECDALQAQLDNANNELLQADDELAAARFQLAALATREPTVADLCAIQMMRAGQYRDVDIFERVRDALLATPTDTAGEVR